MAEEVIIQVDFDVTKATANLAAASKEVARLREQQKQLTQAIKAGNDANGENTAKLAAVKTELAAANKAMQSNVAVLQLANEQRKKENLTLDEQRQQLAAAQKALGAYTAAEIQNTKEGQELLAQTKALSDSVKAQEQAFGDARRNVGNYGDAVVKGLGGIGVAVTALKTKLLSLIKNPWVAILTALAAAIVAVVKNLANAFKSSESRMRELQTAFAPFQGVLNAVQRAFDSLASAISKGVTAALNGLSSALSWVMRQLDKLGNAFGKDWGLAERLEATTTATKNIAQAEQDLVDKKRAFALEEAQIEAKISELRAKANEKDTQTIYQRLDALEEARKLEEQLGNKRKSIAQDELALAQMKAAETENDAAANEDLVEKQVAVINATTQANNAMRELNGTIAELRKNTEEYAAILATGGMELSEDEITAILNSYSKLGEGVVKTMEELQEEYGVNLLHREEEDEDDILAPELVAAQLGMTENGLALYRQRLQEGVDAQKAFAEAMELSEAEMAEEHKKKVQEMADTLGVLSDSFGTISDALADYAGESEAASKASKVFAVGQIVASQAQSIAQGALAISEGVASAASIPFPGNIPAIISIVAQIGAIVASVASSIKQAKSVIEGGSFATGGIVGGTSYSGDRVQANVNSGEMILNKQQQSQLFDIATGKEGAAAIDYDRMQAAFSAALENMPAPVLVYKDFLDFESEHNGIYSIIRYV